ncbi:MAG: glycosyltransferase family 39 protein [Crocinitomicaceae bacterium]|nr:glycosyltransferase family 39 protein [Crocinitomicaceae bacterium]
MGVDSIKEFCWKYKYLLIFGGVLLVYFLNLFVDIMEVDAAQYSIISMEMSSTKSFLHVYEYGKDYLDKPPLLFWLNSLSFMAFGLSNFAYKLPSVLVALLGLYSTYRFANIFYSKKVSIFSAIILGTSQALFLITNDVRTDTLLIGFTMFSVWQMAAYIRTKSYKHLLLTSLGIALAMMAKGPLVLIILAAGFGTHFLMHKEWKNIFKIQWILLLTLVGVWLIPMCYGLYTQFDLHPEKEAYGLQGPSGIRFFFWTQSFGRITGESSWADDSSYFYFTHSILWDFQPWIFFFIPALFKKIRNTFLTVIGKISANGEYITLGTFVFVFIALSMSRYKLPHYIFGLFPFAAVITANSIFKIKEKYINRISAIQFGVEHIFWVAILIIFTFVFSDISILLIIVLSLIYIAFFMSFKLLKDKHERILIPTVITAIAFNLMMASHFYPNILSYQGSSQVGKYALQKKLNLRSFNTHGHSLHFYAREFIPYISVRELIEAKEGEFVYTNEKGYQEIKTHRNVKIKRVFPSHRAAIITLPFLMKNTRKERLNNEYILELK